MIYVNVSCHVLMTNTTPFIVLQEPVASQTVSSSNQLSEAGIVTGEVVAMEPAQVAPLLNGARNNDHHHHQPVEEHRVLVEDADDDEEEEGGGGEEEEEVGEEEDMEDDVFEADNHDPEEDREAIAL